MSPREPLTYSSYLKIDELLALQQPAVGRPGARRELFIVIHQVYELWFKQMLHEMDYLQRLLEEGDGLARARHLQADPHDPEGAGGADRHARDDDAARVPLLPRAARVGQRVPVVPVPRARVRARAQAAGRAGPLSGRQRPPARGWSAGSASRRSGTRSCASSARAAHPVPAEALARDVTEPVEPRRRHAAGADRRLPRRRSDGARCASGWWISTRGCRSGATAT